jgi:hypothetical protein
VRAGNELLRSCAASPGLAGCQPPARAGFYEMAVGMLVRIPGGTAEYYDSVMEHLDWDNAPKPQGFISHYAGSTDDGWLVFDVWESRQDFERFAQERLMTALSAASDGEAPALNPVFAELHNQDHARA